jgi:hypothetical protein
LIRLTDFTEATHPPSRHRCNRYPILILDIDNYLYIVCWECYTIWHTGVRDSGSEKTLRRSYRAAEERYGGDPSLVTNNRHHPLFVTYNLPPGYLRCVCCGKPRKRDEFGIDRRQPDCRNRVCRPCHSEQTKLSRLRAPRKAIPPNP